MTDPKPSTLPLGHEFVTPPPSWSVQDHCAYVIREFYLGKEHCGQPRAAHEAPPTPVPDIPYMPNHAPMPRTHASGINPEPAAPLPQPEPPLDSRALGDEGLRWEPAPLPQERETITPTAWTAAQHIGIAAPSKLESETERRNVSTLRHEVMLRVLPDYRASVAPALDALVAGVWSEATARCCSCRFDKNAADRDAKLLHECQFHIARSLGFRDFR